MIVLVLVLPRRRHDRGLQGEHAPGRQPRLGRGRGGRGLRRGGSPRRRVEERRVP
jgi:hypothetical protein